MFKHSHRAVNGLPSTDISKEPFRIYLGYRLETKTYVVCAGSSVFEGPSLEALAGTILKRNAQSNPFKVIKRAPYVPHTRKTMKGVQGEWQDDLNDVSRLELKLNSEKRVGEYQPIPLILGGRRESSAAAFAGVAFKESYLS